MTSERRAGGDTLVLMSRLARRTLLPSLVLAGFAPTAAAAVAMGRGGVAASSAVFSPLLTNRWCVDRMRKD